MSIDWRPSPDTARRVAASGSCPAFRRQGDRDRCGGLGRLGSHCGSARSFGPAHRRDGRLHGCHSSRPQPDARHPQRVGLRNVGRICVRSLDARPSGRCVIADSPTRALDWDEGVTFFSRTGFGGGTPLSVTSFSVSLSRMNRSSASPLLRRISKRIGVVTILVRERDDRVVTVRRTRETGTA